jgi:hypothetical protein
MSEVSVQRGGASPTHVQIVRSLPRPVPFLVVRTETLCALLVNWRAIRLSAPQFIVIAAVIVVLGLEFAADLLRNGTLEIFWLFQH